MPLARYASLWANSPFTSKPPPPVAGPLVNPLDDYALIGVSPIGVNGYRITLINKKQPDQRITVDSGSTKTDFKILEVIRKSGDPLGTTVRMTSGSMTGIVSFDESLLTLVKAQQGNPGNLQPTTPTIIPPIAQPQAPPSQHGHPNPPPGGPFPTRQPRPRVIPPPVAPPTAQPPGAAGQPVPPAPQNVRQLRRPN